MNDTDTIIKKRTNIAVESDSSKQVVSGPEANRLVTIPNLLSIGRVLLLIPLFIFLRQGREGGGNFLALTIMAAALLTDLLDGLIARLFHQESEWGKVLDPLADKVWIACLGLFLALPWRENPLPWPFLVLILVRDATIVGCAYFAWRRTGKVMTSNIVGKLAMASVALTLILYTVNLPPLYGLTPGFFMQLSSALIILSGLVYFLRFRKTLRKA